MTEEQTTQVPRPVLEGLIEGWEDWIARHDYDGTAEEYQGAVDAVEKCCNDLETVMENL